jgi:hypothetical protein
MSIIGKFKESRIGIFWLKYEKNIVLMIGIIIIAIASFEAGFLKGQKNKQDPVIVNQTACAPCVKSETTSPDSGSPADIQTNNENQLNVDNQECAFVASKNSNKYHLATCSWALRIKPENRICFSSKSEAENRGYVGAKCCIK